MARQEREIKGGTILYVLTDEQLQKMCEEIFERCWAKFKEEQPPQETAPLHPLNYWCQKLHVDRCTLWRWQKEGRITGVKIGGKVFYRASDFEKLGK